ncbi:hypothetical protein BN7_3588 [Wickerhamomyces ciferrii]|uniref:Uncharacterized protein n=1 Tax=Wickerhamomyces ciferrii (strain ATCC 14091 / BCRC 22168 / CBS 111 / JCM 3599 / NBRC 0793 / NRRL Y-1031 F-60-10) TaxID=1206466 RepID=K0KM02_WICCF|nr:uncharacterized protein BN7_3588 [Wickerhamomyces ciferrii]CCH44031.1 hypothetical protein BN7_3588 [Wickerhamomyces ciferrii]
MSSEVINSEHPVKLVLLGGPAVGKSTFANNIHSKFFRETYYPTHKSTILLFEYKPRTKRAKSILDEYGGLEAKKLINQQNDLQLSPTIFQSYNKNHVSLKKRRNSSSSNANSQGKANKSLVKNDYYSYDFPNNDNSIEGQYQEPNYSPILIELIDTPPFKPDLVVPFLEVSLYRNLDKEDLHNLANEPRRPVSTNPLLVASGASEMNGNVNGYIFMYSAVPSFNPPSYDDVLSPSTSRNSSITTDSNQLNTVTSQEDPLSLLDIIRGAIIDAWREYRNYQKKWKKGSEGDVYSLIYGIKQLWKLKSYEEEQLKLAELRKISNRLDEIDIDPSSPDSPPPILIVCTHSKHEGKSPKLIEDGKKLANNWKSSFILVENEINENVDESISLMIREIVERQKLQKIKKKLGK